MSRYRTAMGLIWLACWLTGCSSLQVGRQPAPTRDAQRHVALLTQEIRDGLERRQIADRFALYEAYTAELLDASAGERTFSDKTGNCRLNWVDYLLRHPIESIAAAETFTWQVQQASLDTTASVQRLVAIAADKLDAGPMPRLSRRPHRWREPDAALGHVETTILAATSALARAYAPLSDEEYQELEAHLYTQSTGGIKLGHRFANQKLGRRVCDLLERLDRAALLEAAHLLASLTSDAFLESLSRLPDADASLTLPGVEGPLVAELSTAAGRILIGGRGSNRYDLEVLHDVCAVIDLGGDDTYVEGTVGATRPVLVILDLGGNDTFTGKLPGIQGGAILGASLLVSRGGDDRFDAEDVAQGSTLGGIGMLVNGGGNNRYTGRRRVQGQAVGGFGLLLDRGGDDQYRGALLAQGVGGPLGFGALIDHDGADHYYAGGLYPGGYDDSPGYGGWSQGVGVGPRGVANGGIGVLLDGGGDDIYEYDYFSHGGGYWFAAGFARDFGGNDQRLGATRTLFDGSAREVRRFVRWGVGYGCHYALGFVIDDEGDDLYTATTAAMAFAWDIAVGAILDFSGNDHYVGPGAGHAANAGLGVLFDVAGNDRYQGRNLGHARDDVAYHPVARAGGNFAFCLDYGGDNDFGPVAKNNEELAQGWAGGFFVSRPAPTAD